MPLDIPTTLEQINNRSLTDVQTELENSDPFLPASWVGSLITANSGRISEFDKQLIIAISNMFPNTSKGQFLQMWGALRGVYINAATQSLGTITITGSTGSPIPVSSVLTTKNGVLFSTQTDAVILNSVSVVQSIVRSGNTAIVTTITNHNFASSINVTISGSDQDDYNGVFQILVTGDKTFTYSVANNPITPATGVILASALSTEVVIKSLSFGSDTNLEGGTAITFTDFLPGIDNTAYVQFDGVTGGNDIESNDSFLTRILFSYANPNTPFNVNEIERLAKTVNGVTSVFVFPIYPELGQVTVYFLRYNDLNPIPSSADVDNVKNVLLTIEPVSTSAENLIVLAPTAKIVNFVFSSLTPNTQSMQQAIRNSLKQAFVENTSVGVTFPQNGYDCAIYQTIDPTTGATVQDFLLSSPIGDITVSFGQIPILGLISFPT